MELRVGYVPLTDAAVLIAAAELGFAERSGLRIVLEKEASWATLRDKLALGLIDAAHMLAPLAIANSLGLGSARRVPLVAPFALNLNGNAITLSARIWAELEGEPDSSAAAVARSLSGLVQRRREAGGPLPTFATVFPYSTHTYLLRRYLKLGGLDPDRDVRVTVVPPPYMADALRSGAIDGFCVGSPWNSVAVEAGWGRIVAFGTEIRPDAPEKVLAWPRDRIPSDIALALLRALREAAEWCASPEHREELASLLSDQRHLGIARHLIQRTLGGRMDLGQGGPERHDPDYLRFGGTVHRPDRRDAAWIYDEMVEAGQVANDAGSRAAAMAVYDPELFDRANDASDQPRN